MKIGVLSDTHDYLDPKVLRIFKGVDHILHGGDIGLTAIILQLESLAPVTAVIGNCDTHQFYPETEVVKLAEHKFLVHHIVDAHALPESLKRKVAKEQPSAVIFGHTHKPFCEHIGGTLFFNPGYSGKPRFNLPRSIAILHCEDGAIRPEYFKL